MFLEVFDVYIWLALLLFYIIIRGLVYARHRYQTYCLIKVSGSHITSLSLYGLLINQPADSSDITESKMLKYFLLLMLFSNVLLVTAYNSRLASVMVSPMYVFT